MADGAVATMLVRRRGDSTDRICAVTVPVAGRVTHLLAAARGALDGFAPVRSLRAVLDGRVLLNGASLAGIPSGAVIDVEPRPGPNADWRGGSIKAADRAMRCEDDAQVLARISKRFDDGGAAEQFDFEDPLEHYITCQPLPSGRRVPGQADDGAGECGGCFLPLSPASVFAEQRGAAMRAQLVAEGETPACDVAAVAAQILREEWAALPPGDPERVGAEREAERQRQRHDALSALRPGDSVRVMGEEGMRRAFGRAGWTRAMRSQLCPVMNRRGVIVDVFADGHAAVRIGGADYTVPLEVVEPVARDPMPQDQHPYVASVPPASLAEAFPPGADVIVHGLASQAGQRINGRYARVLGLRGQRVLVSFDDPALGTPALLPANLRVPTAAAEWEDDESRSPSAPREDDPPVRIVHRPPPRMPPAPRPAATDQQVLAAWREGTLSKLSCKDLKTFLGRMGAAQKGNKKDLVERVTRCAAAFFQEANPLFDSCDGAHLPRAEVHAVEPAPSLHGSWHGASAPADGEPLGEEDAEEGDGADGNPDADGHEHGSCSGDEQGSCGEYEEGEGEGYGCGQQDAGDDPDQRWLQREPPPAPAFGSWETPTRGPAPEEEEDESDDEIRVCRWRARRHI